LVDNKLIKYCPIYSLIVIANDKTIINKRFAQPNVKELIVKHDLLISKLEEYKQIRGYVMKKETVITTKTPIDMKRSKS